MDDNATMSSRNIGFGLHAFAFLRSSALHLRSSASPKILAGVVLAASTFSAQAAVTVTDAWVRGTVPAQTTTGAFATLTSSENAKLVAVKTPAAKSVEIHRSDMRGGVMRMEAVDAVPLPAGKAVKLEEGGFHVMLMGVARPIKAGTKVPLEFVVEDAKGKRSTISTQAPVRPLGQ
jgi:periplasmic copper chaperone A